MFQLLKAKIPDVQNLRRGVTCAAKAESAVSGRAGVSHEAGTRFLLAKLKNSVYSQYTLRVF